MDICFYAEKALSYFSETQSQTNKKVVQILPFSLTANCFVISLILLLNSRSRSNMARLILLFTDLRTINQN